MSESKFSRSAIVAWTLCACVIVFSVIAVLEGLNTSDIQGNALLGARFVFGVLGIAAFGIVGALIIASQPRNTIGWLMMLIAFPTMLVQIIPTQNIAQQTIESGAAPTLPVWLVIWVSGWSWWFLIGPLLLIPVLFPTGRPLSPRWRWVIAGLALNFLVFIGFTALADRLVTLSGTSLPNPIGVVPLALMDEFFNVPWSILIGTNALLCVSAIFIRYRRAPFAERQQIKWLLSACAFFLAVYVPSGIFGDEPNDFAKILELGFSLAILGIPVAIGIAILRYRLFDIDILIRRTLTYTLVTALLVIVFFGSVILLQQIFSTLIGSGQNEIVTVLSTLAIAALFVPVRSRIQTEIDKRFNRKKYDAQQVLNDFATTVRDETNLEKLTARLMQVVDETMQPRSVSVWLRKEGRGMKDVSPKDSLG